MLDGKGEVFNAEPVGLPKQAVEIEAQRMRSEFAAESGAQAPEGFGMVGLDPQLSDQLAADGLDDGAPAILEAGQFRIELDLLVPARHAQQLDASLLTQLLGDRLTEIGFIPDHDQIAVPTQQFCARCEVGAVGRGQTEIADQPTERHQQMQFVAEDGLLFTWDSTEGGARGLPGGSGRRTGYQMEVQDRNRQAINRALGIVSQVEVRKDPAAQRVECAQQVTAPTVKAAAFGNDREEVRIVLEGGHQLGLDRPTTAFADQHHGEQFTISAAWRGTRATGSRNQFSQQIVDEDIDVQTEVGEVGYHRNTSSLASGLGQHHYRYRLEASLSTSN